MSEPAAFDQNLVDSWFFHRWKEQSLSFKKHVLKNLFDKFKRFKTEFKNTPKMVSYTGILEKVGVAVLCKAFRCCKEANRWPPSPRMRDKKVQLNRFWFSRFIDVFKRGSVRPPDIAAGEIFLFSILSIRLERAFNLTGKSQFSQL